MRLVLVLFISSVLSGCSSRPSNLPAGPQAYAAIPAVVDATDEPYRIGPMDKLRVDVLQEEDLSIEELPVDVNGQVSLPLVGSVQVAGRSAQEVAAEMASRLQRFLVQPQVTVNVIEFTSQKVTVGGEVQRAGMYVIPGRVRLTQAIALAEGTDEYAKLDEVVVFREEAGQRLAARFDLGAISRGEAQDPIIKSNDIVLVGLSTARQRFRDILAVLPSAAGIFVTLAN